MKLVRTFAGVALACFAAAPLAAQQTTLQERLDLAALARIRDEGMNRSQVDTLAQQLLDGIGSRLTASPQMRRAQEWAAQTLRGWGLVNVQVEPWDSLFGRGWERVSYSGRMLEPVMQPLRAEPQAWSGSTRGAVTCPVVYVELPEDTLQLQQYAGRLRGACVMWQRWTPIGPEYNPSPRRYDADTILAWSVPRPAQAQPQQPQQGPNPQAMQEFRARQQRQQAMMRFIRREGPAVLLVPSGWTYGILRTGGHPDGRLARDSVYEPIPTLMVTHEQYGQLYRLARRGVTSRLEVNVQNRFSNPDKREFNVLGEIPGTDLRSQYVVIGGHYDSWHSGQGATDDGAGSLVMMEAMRILRALNLPMRRTVRIGLWSGEEQGLLGSAAYARTHAAELPNTSVYLNVDNGGGRLRGVYGELNEPALQVWEQILAPFHDLGYVGNNPGRTGGTDHISFWRRGVPGFQFIQDPLEYGIRTHHSHVDTYERLVMDDLKQAATIVAWAAYHFANRDEMMPRPAAAFPGTN
jgi:hypothetical protein